MTKVGDFRKQGSDPAEDGDSRARDLGAPVEGGGPDGSSEGLITETFQGDDGGVAGLKLYPPSAAASLTDSAKLFGEPPPQKAAHQRSKAYAPGSLEVALSEDKPAQMSNLSEYLDVMLKASPETSAQVTYALPDGSEV